MSYEHLKQLVLRHLGKQALPGSLNTRTGRLQVKASCYSIAFHAFYARGANDQTTD